MLPVRGLGQAFLLEITKSKTSCPRRRSSSAGLAYPRVSRGQAIAKLLGNGPTSARITFFVCVIGGPQFARQAAWACPRSLIIPTNLPLPSVKFLPLL